MPSSVDVTGGQRFGDANDGTGACLPAQAGVGRTSGSRSLLARPGSARARSQASQTRPHKSVFRPLARSQVASRRQVEGIACWPSSGVNYSADRREFPFSPVRSPSVRLGPGPPCRSGRRWAIELADCRLRLQTIRLPWKRLSMNELKDDVPVTTEGSVSGGVHLRDLSQAAGHEWRIWPGDVLNVPTASPNVQLPFTHTQTQTSRRSSSSQDEAESHQYRSGPMLRGVCVHACGPAFVPAF